jgi:hypothetical protein
VEAVLEGFGFADSFIAVECDLLNEGVDPLENLAVLGLPPQVVGPGAFVPDEFHPLVSSWRS